ncbi:hypothetical protein B0T14DRAFT_563983 [Immersiella caudata]|uniref:Uncharacterized protein n=1 Tax=Immersiella caudata TaxID=314043 RepID=A0AA40C2F5_9PEZI|nr:hypothetical protein B0T14DRAFT_563983 [Immersiella caudata]
MTGLKKKTAKQKSEAGFSRFLGLPQEIQDKIWGHALETEGGKKMISMELYIPPDLWLALSDLRHPARAVVPRDVRLCLEPSAPHQGFSFTSRYRDIASKCKSSFETISPQVTEGSGGVKLGGRHLDQPRDSFRGLSCDYVEVLKSYPASGDDGFITSRDLIERQVFDQAERLQQQLRSRQMMMAQRPGVMPSNLRSRALEGYFSGPVNVTVLGCVPDKTLEGAKVIAGLANVSEKKNHKIQVSRQSYPDTEGSDGSDGWEDEEDEEDSDDTEGKDSEDSGDAEDSDIEDSDADDEDDEDHLA